ncbi:MAG TPA: hypothetical protein PKL15_07180 [Saprospiraceae bacterium]|nr:hypothetical protein [Saprospiraceae bacterium]
MTIFSKKITGAQKKPKPGKGPKIFAERLSRFAPGAHISPEVNAGGCRTIVSTAAGICFVNYPLSLTICPYLT